MFTMALALLGYVRVEYHRISRSSCLLLCPTAMDACDLWFDLRSALRIHVVLLAESHPFCNVRASDVDPLCQRSI